MSFQHQLPWKALGLVLLAAFTMQLTIFIQIGR